MHLSKCDKWDCNHLFLPHMFRIQSSGRTVTWQSLAHQPVLTLQKMHRASSLLWVPWCRTWWLVSLFLESIPNELCPPGGRSQGKRDDSAKLSTVQLKGNPREPQTLELSYKTWGCECVHAFLSFFFSGHVSSSLFAKAILLGFAVQVWSQHWEAGVFVYLQKEANDICLRVSLRAEGAVYKVLSPCLVLSNGNNCHIMFLCRPGLL